MVLRWGRDLGHPRTIRLPCGRAGGWTRMGTVPCASGKGAPCGATQWRADHRGGRFAGGALGSEPQRRGHADSPAARRACPASRRDAADLSRGDEDRPTGRLQRVLRRRIRGESQPGHGVGQRGRRTHRISCRRPPASSPRRRGSARPNAALGHRRKARSWASAGSPLLVPR